MAETSKDLFEQARATLAGGVLRLSGGIPTLAGGVVRLARAR